MKPVRSISPATSHPILQSSVGCYLLLDKKCAFLFNQWSTLKDWGKAQRSMQCSSISSIHLQPSPNDGYWESLATRVLLSGLFEQVQIRLNLTVHHRVTSLVVRQRLFRNHRMIACCLKSVSCCEESCFYYIYWLGFLSPSSSFRYSAL